MFGGIISVLPPCLFLIYQYLYLTRHLYRGLAFSLDLTLIYSTNICWTLAILVLVVRCPEKHSPWLLRALESNKESRLNVGSVRARISSYVVFHCIPGTQISVNIGCMLNEYILTLITRVLNVMGGKCKCHGVYKQEAFPALGGSCRISSPTDRALPLEWFMQA